MGTKATGRQALMSIRPEFAEQILAGTKRIEFRKRPLANDVTGVIVYATAPTKAIVGAFRVAGQDTRPPRDLWSEYSDVAGIAREPYLRYYAGRGLATGILVGDVYVAPAPLALSYAGVRRAPQSFQYLTPAVGLRLLAAMSPAEVLARTA
jgi:predicted transcriptional regulator